MIGQGGGSGGSSKHPQNAGASRSLLRKNSHVVRALVEIVGTSGKIYHHLIDLCKVSSGVLEGLVVWHAGFARPCWPLVSHGCS